MLALTLAGTAAAQTRPAARPAQTFDLGRQDLGQALSAVALASGREVVVSQALVVGKTAPPLKGRFTADEAFDRLLAGTGLTLVPVGDKLVLRRTSAETTPGEPHDSVAETLSELVVTGTRIRGAAPVGGDPIVITRQDIDRAGFSTAQQILQSVPQNFGGGPGETTSGTSSRNGAPFNTAMGSGVNLRGLGSNSTLVLINGVRPAGAGIAGTFTDLSVIPASALERVEVLADGASALYGSDAVAGVVNFVMRDRFEGAETRLRYGSADGEAREVQASLVLGKIWGAGGATLAYEYYDRQALAADTRAFATEDLRAFGGADYRQPYAAPGTILAGGQSYAIPAGQDGGNLTVDQLLVGQDNVSDAYRNADLLPQQRRHSLYLSGRQALSAHTRVFVQGLAAQRTFDQRILGGNRLTVSVPSSNPFYINPLGGTDPVLVRYDFTGDLGATHTNGRVRAFNGLAGVTRELGDWSATVQGGLARQQERYRIDNYGPNGSVLAAALADSDPATAYNVFGDPGSTPRATIDAVRGWYASQSLFKTWSAGVRAEGPLASLPAGQIRLALGAERRSERYTQSSTYLLFGASPFTAQTEYPPTRDITAVYAELRAPLVSPTMGVSGIQALDLSVAGRIERYSDVGSTANPKIGLDWRPTTDLLLRASYGTSFRAPSFQDLRQGPSVNAYQPSVLTDPQSPSGNTTVLTLLGNAPDMDPEQATTWTAGLTYKPSQIPGLNVSATYYDIDYRDRIANVNANAFNILIERDLYGEVIDDHPSAATIAAYYTSPLLYNPGGIAASAVTAIVDLRNRNLSRVRQRGLDLDVGYAISAPWGDINLGLSGSYIFSIDQQVTNTSPTVDVVGTVGNPTDLRLRGRAGWSRGPWTVTGFVNFTSNYENQTVSPRQGVDSWTTADLQLAYTVPDNAPRLRGVRLALTATNLFDRDPPFAEMRTVVSAIGYDGEKADPSGRRVALEITKSW
ncbi:TonB-dependent receptor [Caulobacter rhizosphaerae]|uniref:TonB-dependent receptor n=1 Tax=Caulobacter rhizosphaerae TaxID=2010972 RepID=UPI0019A6743D|nr:TonB-dependent receptor [Caulobacter rhizosphaerae]GGL36007.1 TonB-dependent receptor [Caulobacter rhizosphaerae]